MLDPSFLCIMADAEQEPKTFRHLKGVAEASIRGEPVEPSTVLDPRRLMTYVRKNAIKGAFLVRCTWKTIGGSSYSKAGKYIIEGVRFPKIMYVPPSGIDTSRNFENLLRAPEKPIRGGTSSVVRNADRANTTGRYRSVD